MALPTADNLKTLDYAYQAQPYVNVPAKAAISLITMDWAYQAQPFVSNPAAAPAGLTILDYERASMRGSHRGIMVGVG